MNLIELTKDAQDRALAKQEQLPLFPNWGHNVRGFPNSLARCALFNVTHARPKRRMFKDEPIASMEGLDIQYTGEELRQDDEDVFLQLLHLARHSPAGTRIEFTGYTMLKQLGWDVSQAYYDRLYKSLKRMTPTMVRIRHNALPVAYHGSLIRKFLTPADGLTDGKRRCVVYLEREIVGLFGGDEFSRIEWEQRLKLGRLAKWLHSFYHSHRDPLPFKVATIHKLCGSTTKNLFHFRSDMKDALAELVAVGFLREGKIDANDLVQAKRTPRRLASEPR